MAENIDLSSKDLSPSRNIFLLTSLLDPRPIAWISRQNRRKIVKIGHFSFYDRAETPLWPCETHSSIEAGERGPDGVQIERGFFRAGAGASNP
jgi:hypothetical protein